MKQIIEDRRALHQIPEIGLDLPETTAYVLNALSGLRCEVTQPIDCSACAYFDFGAAHTIAFRGDMDALPVTEKTGLEFASRHPGKMHACGHDGHTAMLLELARQLDAMEKAPVNVLLIFQPAEETIGGAEPICRTGVLQKYGVEAVFAQHLWPEVPYGEIGTLPGPMMARTSEVTVDIFGKSSHIGRPKEGINAMTAAVKFLDRCDQLEKGLPPETRRIMGFGRMESGTARNAISEHSHIEGTVRAYHDKVFDFLTGAMDGIGESVAKETGCRVEIHRTEGYPAVVNDEALLKRVEEHTGRQFYRLPEPTMIAEDFSWYQKEVPGIMFFLGIGGEISLHSEKFVFDEKILTQGADFFRSIVETW